MQYWTLSQHTFAVQVALFHFFGAIFLYIILKIHAFVGTTMKEPICNVYMQPNFWYPLKYLFFRGLMRFRKYRNSNNTIDDSGTAGYGQKSKNSVEEMDCIQKLSKQHPMAVDAVYFNAGSEEGCYMVAAAARRQKNILQTPLILRIPEFGWFQLPSTTQQMSHPEKWSAAGLLIEPIEPMKKWRIAFDGELKRREDEKMYKVNFDLEWNAISDYFDFDVHINEHAIADAVCREAWSREYFNTLKEAHQTHYEQFGRITGKINIEELGTKEVRMEGVRDHSYGNHRDWRQLHRYGIQYSYLNNGTCVCLGIVSLPITLSRLVIGYVFLPNGKMVTISSTDLELYHHGEQGRSPQQWGCTFVADNQTYSYQCNVLDWNIFIMGDDDAAIHERFCTYEINGVKGWGTSEWEYALEDAPASKEMT